MKIGCVLLAAGAGVRFGGDKLKACFSGKTILENILSELPAELFARCVIVAADNDLLQTAGKYGIRGVINDQPELGIARSIRMGLKTLLDMDACMFCVSDQPFLKGQTIRGMLENYKPGTILSLAFGGKRGNPVIFPSSLFGELLRLPKSEFGIYVIKAHPELLLLYEAADPLELADIDTKEE
ncbi:MAG: nucleotidyltransferase family protein, partial [Eubacteriales bacterium]